MKSSKNASNIQIIEQAISFIHALLGNMCINSRRFCCSHDPVILLDISKGGPFFQQGCSNGVPQSMHGGFR